MDSQGFVFLSVFTTFNRIRQLTGDINLLRHVCRLSSQIDYQIGIDNRDRVRPIGWQSWVLAMDERDVSAQSEGPSQFLPIYSDYMAQDPQSMLAGSMPPLSTNGYSPPSQMGEAVAVNGNDLNGSIANGGVTQTPLSASVPDFQPQLPRINHFQGTGQAENSENTFDDERVKDLVIVTRTSDSTQAHGKTPVPRSLSNSSMDPNARSDDLSTGDGQATANGGQKYVE